MSEQSGSVDELADMNRTLYEDGKTDGLPIVPPTPERVDEMLRGTDHQRDHVIGEIGNNENPLTVEQLAANAVMAGCVPSYMPVLEAGARALADPASNSIQFSVSTGSWAYLWMVNGPVCDQLDIESGSGAFGPSFHANQSIARALGIAYRNTAKIYPGEKDMGVMGHPGKFYMLAGENREMSPWEPYHETQGYDTDESTITLAGPNSWIQWLPSENTAEHVLKGMVESTPGSIRARTGEVLSGTVFHVMNPYNAEELEKADLSKEDVKNFLVEHSAGNENALEETVGYEVDIDLPVPDEPQYYDADAINLATIGGPGRVSLIIGTAIGGPVTHEIEFPNGWEELAEEYRFERNWVPVDEFYG